MVFTQEDKIAIKLYFCEKANSVVLSAFPERISCKALVASGCFMPLQAGESVPMQESRLGNSFIQMLMQGHKITAVCLHLSSLPIYSK